MAKQDDIKVVAKREKEILEQEKRIERAEANIEREEKRIEHVEREILRHKRLSLRTIFTPDLTPQERYFVHRRILKRFAKHKIIFSLLLTTGVVLVWRGIWHTADELPIISISLVSLGVGLAILWLVNRDPNTN